MGANKPRPAIQTGPVPTETHPYSLRQIEQMLGLTRPVIASLIAAGFVTPQRGLRNAYRFSFQDVVLLRTAHQLREAQIPLRRLMRSLKQLKAKLPDEMPLSGLRIKVIGNDVAVRDADAQWEDPRGQLVMDFELSPRMGANIHTGSFDGSSVAAASAAAATTFDNQTSDPAALYNLALHHESSGNTAEAARAYRRLLSQSPSHIDAAINLSALLCESGHCAAALAVADRAIAAGGERTALLHFNRAIALEDLPGRDVDSQQAYLRCLELDPMLADAHYNLARLHEKHGHKQAALRHFSAYRRLQR